MMPAHAKRAMLDASVALSWVIPDEGGAEGVMLRDLAVKESTVLLCPPAFWFEVANVLWAAVRRERLDVEDALQALSSLEDFGIVVTDVAAGACLALSSNTGLAAYDTAYLVAALADEVPLWTFDRRMRETGEALGLTVAP